MEKEVKIEIEVLNPYMLFFEEKNINTIKNLFLRMLTDIRTSKIHINLDGKNYEIYTEFKENISHLRGYATLNLYYKLDIDGIWNNYDIYDNKGNKQALTKEELYSQKLLNLAGETEKFIMDFTFATNLAYPGLFEFASAKIFIDNVEQKNSEIGLTLAPWVDTYIFAVEQGWPEMRILNIQQVWEWLNNKTNYIRNGMSKTPIDRALNALSYIIGKPGYEEMFYIMIGIEAIYNDNKDVTVSEQLRTKTKLLLNIPKQYKKKITTIYDNSHEFIHGRINFPNSYYKYNATKEFDDFFFNKYMQTVNNFLAVLISTIQEFIIQNANELKLQMNLKLK